MWVHKTAAANRGSVGSAVRDGTTKLVLYCALVGSVSCGRPVERLTLADDVEGVLFVFEPPDERDVKMFALEVEPGAFFDRRRAPDEPVIALLYSRSVHAQQMVGELKPAAPGAPSRALPPATSMLALEDDTGWRTTESEPTLADIRIPAFDVAECANEAGCLSPETGPEFCHAPCPFGANPREPDLPLAPAPPRDPESPPTLPELPPSIDCSPFEVQHFGRQGCEPLGASCPASGLWPTDAPNNALFVSADAPPNGDGSALAPFSTIAEAILAASNGAVVLVRGTFTEDVVLDRNIELRGVCVERSVVQGAIEFRGDGTVRDLHIIGGVLSGAGAIHLSIDGVLIDSPGSTGMFLSDRAVANANDLVIRDRTIGIDVSSSTITGNQIVLEGNAAAGLRGELGSFLSIHDTVVRSSGNLGIHLTQGSRLSLDGAQLTAKIALVASSSAALEAEELYVSGDPGAIETGLRIDTGARVSIEGLRMSAITESAIEAIHASAIRIDGVSVAGSRRAMSVDRCGTVRLGHGQIEGTTEEAILFVDTSSATLSDLLFHQLAYQALSVQRSRVTIARVRVDGWTDDAIFASGSGARVEVLDAHFAGTPSTPTHVALASVSGAEIFGTRIRMEDLAPAGALGNAGTKLHLEDLDIAGVTATEVTSGGNGVTVIGGALELSRARFARVDSAVAIFSTESATISDVRVASQPMTEFPGVLAMSSTARLERIRIEGPRESAGIAITGVRNGPATISDLDVEGCRIGVRLEQADARIADLSIRTTKGDRSAAIESERSVLSVRRFRLANNEGVGLNVIGVSEGATDLSEGAIVENSIGVRLDAPGYDLSRILDRVRFEGNGTTISDGREVAIE